MQYHIQTTPIWDSFKEKCHCPMCKIYNISENRLIKQYLGGAVMLPEYRVKVNQRGFCARHTLALYNGDNKLGTALQLQTRTEAVNKQIISVKNAKRAKVLAKQLAETLDTCVICDTVDEMMVRYSYTVAQMYANEKDFPKLFSESDGFCMKHFIQLMYYADYAGKSAEQYLRDLISVQKRALSRCESDLDGFAAQFDYRHSSSGSDRYNNALKNAILKLKGDIF